MAALILGIETSCDETAAAVLACAGDGPGEIRSNIVWGQVDLHGAYGGVVPEIAARAHAERVDHCIEAALEDAGVGLSGLDAMAVTAGPGLIGGLLAGVMAAKGIAMGASLPLIGVNHLAGHALTPRLTEGLAFPYLMLLVSGGHCQLLVAEGAERFTRLGGTIDDAPGEAFDKVAKLMGLGYPGGPEIERVAAAGDPGAVALPRPLLDRPGAEMSFSGLKTAVRRALDLTVAAEGGLPEGRRADLAAGFQAAVAEVLAEKTRRAAADYLDRFAPPAPALAVAGGVAANRTIRAALEGVAAEAGLTFAAPPLRLCTDNAAMIAWAGWERFRTGARDDLTLAAHPRWPLDFRAALAGAEHRGGGGVEG
ncbi:MAG: tRNA (adenosine(37)-N6)-threonylcarbamoyltransferase complex transferase subunit TsaD, partial [Pseudomonadota bacterium]